MFTSHKAKKKKKGKRDNLIFVKMILLLFFSFTVIKRMKINYLGIVLQHTESIFCAI